MKAPLTMTRKLNRTNKKEYNLTELHISGRVDISFPNIEIDSVNNVHEQVLYKDRLYVHDGMGDWRVVNCEVIFQ